MKRSKHRLTQWSMAIGLGVLGSLSVSTLVFAQYSKRPAVEQVDQGNAPTPEMEKANIETVTQFLAALTSKDFAKVESMLADNIEWRPNHERSNANSTIGLMGKAAVLKELTTRGEFRSKVLRSVAIGSIVVNERDDHVPAAPVLVPLRPAAVPERDIRVQAGVFHVERGKIREWTDYTGSAVSAAEQKANIAVVNAFNDTYEAKDLAKATSFMAYNIAKKNPGETWGQAVLTREMVTANLKQRHAAGDIIFRVNRIRRPSGELVDARTFTMGPIVLHERDDLLPGRGGAPGRWILVQAGVFSVEGGKIVDWGDYRQ